MLITATLATLPHVICKFDRITKQGEDQFTHWLDTDFTTTSAIAEKTDISPGSLGNQHLRLGDDPRRNLKFDSDGNPQITVDPLEIEVQNSMLMEHDERFHHDFPGI